MFCKNPIAELERRKWEIMKEIESFAKKLLGDLSGVDKDTLTHLRKLLADSDYSKFLQGVESFRGEFNVNLNRFKTDLEDQIVYAIPENFGAVGDGLTDDTEAFENMLASGARFICITGSYKITGFSIPSNVCFFGNGVLIVEGKYIEDFGNRGFIIENANNVLFDGITIESGVNVLELFYVNNSDNVKITNVIVNGYAFDGLTVLNGLTKAITVQNSRNIIVSRCKIDGTNGKAIEFDTSEDIQVLENTITHTGRAGISLYFENKNAIIRGNVLKYNVIDFTIADGAIDVYDYSDNVTIEDNFVSGFGSSKQGACGIRSNGGNGVIIQNNTVVADSGYSTYAIGIGTRNTNSVGVTIRGNRFIQETPEMGACIRIQQLNLEKDENGENFYVEGVLITENDFDVKSSCIGVSIRNGVENIEIVNNYFRNGDINIQFSDAPFNNEPARISNNVVVSGNRLTGYCQVKNATNGLISNNFTKEKSILGIALANSHYFVISGNVGRLNAYYSTPVSIGADCTNCQSINNTNLNKITN